MTQFYSFTEYGEPSLTAGGWIFIALFAVFMIAGAVKLFKFFIRPTGISDFLTSLGTIIVPVVALVILIVMFNADKSNYQQAQQLYSSGNYTTVEDKIEDFDYETVDDSDEYYISFKVNGIAVDEDSFITDGTFTKDEVKTLRNANKVKIEYTKEINDNVTILTISTE